MKLQPTEAPPVAAGPPPHPWQWSIDEAWTWLGHAWRTVIHMPYLGLLSLLLAAALVLALIAKVLGSR